LSPESILYPAIALLWWTVVILLLVPYRRLNPRINGGAKFEDYKLGESKHVSTYVALPNRNYINLLELPVLFYISCTFLYLTETVSEWTINLAWMYVTLRIVHSLIHVTYNSVPHRFTVFVVSNLVLCALMILMTLYIVGL